MNKNIKINHDYFALTNRWQNLKYFISQGHIFSHIIDRIKWYYFPRYFAAAGFPTHIEIESSSACQMRCPMCKTTEMVNRGINFTGVMDFTLYKKIIDECSREACYSIKLSWRGEPLLNPRITDMVSYAKKSGIKDVAFLTNGERLNNVLAEELVNVGLDWLSVSFDGLEDVYNKIRKPAVFKETLRKIKYIREYRDKSKKKKPLIRMQSVHSAIKGRETDFLEVLAGIADRVNFIADQKRSIDEKDYCLDPAYICPSPWQRMCIAWDGKVAQCYGDYMMGNILGDVNKDSIRNIWLGENFKKLRDSMKQGKRLTNKPCRSCSDGGITAEEEISVEGRKIKAVRYVHQSVDVKTLESKIKTE